MQMSTLDKLKKHESGIITEITASKELKNRFNSLGLFRGAKVFVETYTLAKNTMEININHTKIALRISEAQTIKIKFDG